MIDKVLPVLGTAPNCGVNRSAVSGAWGAEKSRNQGKAEIIRLISLARLWVLEILD